MGNGTAYGKNTEELIDALIFNHERAYIVGASGLYAEDYKRGIFVAQRALDAAGVALMSRCENAIMFVEYTGPNGSGVMNRYIGNSLRCVEVQKAIMEYELPDTPPLSESMLADIRERLEIVTNCVCGGIATELQLKPYRELVEQFTDIALAGGSFVANANGTDDSPRVVVALYGAAGHFVNSGPVWMTGGQKEGRYKPFSATCLSIVKGLANASKAQTSLHFARDW